MPKFYSLIRRLNGYAGYPLKKVELFEADQMGLLGSFPDSTLLRTGMEPPYILNVFSHAVFTTEDRVRPLFSVGEAAELTISKILRIKLPRCFSIKFRRQHAKSLKFTRRIISCVNFRRISKKFPRVPQLAIRMIKPKETREICSPKFHDGDKPIAEIENYYDCGHSIVVYGYDKSVVMDQIPEIADGFMEAGVPFNVQIRDERNRLLAILPCKDDYDNYKLVYSRWSEEIAAEFRGFNNTRNKVSWRPPIEVIAGLIDKWIYLCAEEFKYHKMLKIPCQTNWQARKVTFSTLQPFDIKEAWA